jgi:hypothetical protein
MAEGGRRNSHWDTLPGYGRLLHLMLRRQGFVHVVWMPVLALALAGCSDLGVKVQLQALCEVSATTLDFGTVALNDVATRTVTVRNAGNADLAGDATVSCVPFQITSGAGPFTLAPGQTLDVTVRFQPTTATSFSCTLDLGAGNPQVTLTGTGALQLPGANWIVVPASLAFAPLVVGQSASKSFEIFSVGTAPLTVNVVAGCGDYVLLSGGGPAVIPPGSSVVVSVSFNPQTAGAKPCDVALGPGIPSLNVTGTAIALISYAVDIQPIFDGYCVSCHPPQNGLNLKNGFSYGKLVSVASTGYPGEVRVVPGDPDNSVLYAKIANSGLFGAPMPPGASGLARPLVDKVRTWILQGALND